MWTHAGLSTVAATSDTCNPRRDIRFAETTRKHLPTYRKQKRKKGGRGHVYDYAYAHTSLSRRLPLSRAISQSPWTPRKSLPIRWRRLTADRKSRGRLTYSQITRTAWSLSSRIVFFLLFPRDASATRAAWRHVTQREWKYASLSPLEFNRDEKRIADHSACDAVLLCPRGSPDGSWSDRANYKTLMHDGKLRGDVARRGSLSLPATSPPPFPRLRIRLYICIFIYFAVGLIRYGAVASVVAWFVLLTWLSTRKVVLIHAYIYIYMYTCAPESLVGLIGYKTRHSASPPRAQRTLHRLPS